MGSDTTIPVSTETKDRLQTEKRDGETWDATLRRLADGEPEREDVADALRRLEEQVNRVPERTADHLVSDLR
ncbi:hypothetical protein M197_gp29 [Haloarcula hispanica tailed virus 2]|uniref:Uncharacterized protein n=1 Tax=Haloarcula hispanica tailed virus 2 TaxID=1273751 RepID=R4T683_9CAUD|nr:hypothetical protein M197_gp29 [Haloarcula hispanica tailed virus 2]AGM11194.1 hypothetical protein HHTV2_29 [Haloarcula hispanica tailed virus 2]